MAFPRRNEELSTKKYIEEQLVKVFRAVEKGFLEQADRSDDLADYWDCWNCKRSTNQFYSGNTKVYAPLIRNAIKARRTRFINQLFPDTGRNVAVISHDDETPDAEVALLEHYIRRADLRPLVVPGLLVAGDVEGQFSLLVTWARRKRNVVERMPQPIRLLGMDLPPEVAAPVEVLKDAELWDEGPEVEVILDSDLLILPATANSIGEALEAGGSVTVIRRWDEKRLEELLEEGEIEGESAEQLLADLRDPKSAVDQQKKNLDAAGIKDRGQGKYALVYRTWCKIEVGTGKDKEKRLVLAYFGGENRILRCRLCPYWCDKPDVISVPVDKLPGNAKGQSQIKPGVADIQYIANDLLCEGLDSATYALLPVLQYDPDQVPNVDALIMDLMALWPAKPGAIQPIQFPVELLDKAFEAVLAAERMINMAMSVSPAQMPQLPTNRKLNQAEVALQQQVMLESSNDTVTAIETGVMTPLVERFWEYDYQFREAEVTIRSYGEMGLKVEMVRVPPQQMGRRWEIVWWGVQASRSAQHIQQQIAAVNVVGSLANHPSVVQSGKRLNLVPVISHVIEAAFSPRLAPKIFEDQADQLSIPVELENQMLSMGLKPMVSPFDNDQEHIQAHMQLLQQFPFGSPQHSETFNHIQHHNASAQGKAMAQAGQQMQQQLQQPGGQPRRQGGARGPTPMTPGGQPGGPRPMRQPPGAMHPDQMPRAGGVIPMPRRM